jgi:hypothetical protein
MSTTNLLAAEVMDRSAALMNDPSKTDYTYLVQLPYLNMAVDELVEALEEANSSPTNQTSGTIVLPVGSNKITPIEHPTPPHYPFDLVEIQAVTERASGSDDGFVPLVRREFLQEFPATQMLGVWTWADQIIQFNTNGANNEREVKLHYVRMAISQAASELSVIGTINSRSYLSYKTAAFCAMFIGENPTRAEVLEMQAEKALERLTGINNKGKQQVMTRHRPFRASYKARGGF